MVELTRKERRYFQSRIKLDWDDGLRRHWANPIAFGYQMKKWEISNRIFEILFPLGVVIEEILLDNNFERIETFQLFYDQLMQWEAENGII